MKVTMNQFRTEWFLQGRLLVTGKSATPADTSVTAMCHQDHILSWMQELPQL